MGYADAQQKSASMKDMVQLLEQKHGLSFVYESGLDLKGTYRGLEPQSEDVDNDLNTVFADAGIDWKRNGKYVVLTPRKPITVSGHITDAQTGETLIAAGVLSDAGSSYGAVTNNFGYYTLTIPGKATAKGRPIRFQYSYVGYEPQVVTLSAPKDTVINIALKPSAEIREAIVAARKDAGIQSTNISSIEVPLTQIKNTPMILGESDVLKAIQLLPGVQGGNEGFTGLYVRGGGPDENLFLLDGVPVYNVDHALGLFSVFQPEAVKAVTLYKGAFPARYGGRVSSILDIRTNDGNMKETHGLLSVGVISDRFHLEGPIIKDRLSYSISARGMHSAVLSPVMRLIMREAYYNYYYYDLNGKITWRINDNDRLYFGVYSGADQLKYREDFEADETVDGTYYYEHSLDGMKLKWGNNVTSLRWNHVFSNQLFANTTIAFNQYRMLMSSTSHQYEEEDDWSYKRIYDTRYNSGIRDYSVKVDFDYNPNPNHLIKFGADYTRHNFIPESLSMVNNEVESGETQIDTTYNMIDRQTYAGNDLSVYIEDDMRIGNRLTVNPGLRASWFSSQGKNYYSLQPRISAKLAFGDFYLKAGYARMAQYVHLLSSSNFSMPTDLWVPITRNIKPVISDQVSAGAYYDGLKGWEFSVEAYWKEMRNILEYKDGSFFLGSSGGWENKVTMGEGRAIGIEFYAQKTLGKLTGWTSYTLARSDRYFSDGSVNNGRPFPYKYDRRHNFNINLNWEVSKRIDLNATWSYMSGGMATIPEDKSAVITPIQENIFDYSIIPSDYVTSRNNYRLPPSHRLNVGMNIKTKNKKGKKGEGTWNISVYNAYNQMNPNFIFLDAYGKDDRIEYRLEKVTILPIIPSFGYTYKF